jgi:hypothetical protein
MVECADQDEVDYYWNALSEGGEQGPCGWLKDRYGLSWQIVPRALQELLADPDRDKAQRVMAAMMQMGKIEVAGLERPPRLPSRKTEPSSRSNGRHSVERHLHGHQAQSVPDTAALLRGVPRPWFDPCERWRLYLDPEEPGLTVPYCPDCAARGVRRRLR